MESMALNEISEAKKLQLKGRIVELSREGKSIRQVARVILKEFNVKLFDDRKHENIS